MIVEHFLTPVVNLFGGRPVARSSFWTIMRLALKAQKTSGVIANGKTKTINPWKAMNTMNDKAPGVPSFWQKRWNAFTKLFSRNKSCACAAGKSSSRGVDETKPTASKAMA